MSNKNNKKSIISKIFSLLWSIILLPFRVIKNFLKAVMKRLRFSIAFKISASYFLLYIVIILIVTTTSSIGYFIYILNDFKTETVASEMTMIRYNVDTLNLIEDILNDKNIKNINIYDENYKNIYTYNKNYGSQKYSNNIILMLEELILNSTYIHSEQIYENDEIYYVNIYYNISFLISQTTYIIVFIFLSGIAGLLLFIPIVSRTSSKLIRPIKNMTEITKTISVNNINTRLDIKDTQDELKELSMTFNEMMNRIEEGYKSQQQFVSDASHELRTPIAVMKGYINMLDRWGKNDKAILEESISAIKNETDNMQDLIEKLLFIARSDKQTLVFTKEDFNISEILFEIEKETIMIDNKHEFEFRFLHDAHVYADKNRVKQAIRILLENAINKKDLSKIFDRLYRAEESRNRQIGGHGLGLSIAKIIILGHKGKIKVKSNIGEGAEFTILLPHI